MLENHANGRSWASILYEDAQTIADLIHAVREGRKQSDGELAMVEDVMWRLEQLARQIQEET